MVYLLSGKALPLFLLQEGQRILPVTCSATYSSVSALDLEVIIFFFFASTNNAWFDLSKIIK